MRAFIVRPFGNKEGVDFDQVEAQLILPALQASGIEGATTQEIVQAGNIRRDMFHLLLTADLVIADISIHNANVFYELGIRHAFRARPTLLLRASVHEVPFDLRTDRYLQYDKSDPGKSVGALTAAIDATVRSKGTDSPVFDLLGPGLIPQDLSRFLVPPDDFREEVHRAAVEGRTGDLSLLAEEAGRLAWAREGWRRVGNAQFDLKSWEPARLTWENVRALDPGDVEANGRLATIYQRLGDLTRADEAVDRVLQQPSVRGPERAELQSLRASNMKRRWLAEWQSMADPTARSEAALRSVWLRKAYEGYSAGFTEDRNHFYSGLNALALLGVMIELGARHPSSWLAQFDSDDDAAQARRKLETERPQLAGAVELSRRSAQRLVEFTGRRDRWLEISTADLACLSGVTPSRVQDRYRAALTDAQPFHLDAARQQLEIFRSLAVFGAGVTAALDVIDELQRGSQPSGAAPSAPTRVLLFTGHRLDAKDRVAKGKPPRFPASAEAQARRLIADAVEREHTGGDVIGISGGASGGDILFHEVCAEQGIRTQLFIVGSREAYVRESVQDGGSEWVDRFNALWDRVPLRVLGNSQGSMDLPEWLRPAREYSVWERSNRWMLNNALVYGASRVTVIALWDQQQGDGPGGTKDMVDTATSRGAKTVILDARALVASEERHMLR